MPARTTRRTSTHKVSHETGNVAVCESCETGAAEFSDRTGSLAKAEISNRNRRDLDDMVLAEPCEPAILEQRLGGLVELDIVLT